MKKKLLFTVGLGFLVLGGVVAAAPADKVTICHHTGSATNPTVTIEVAQAAVNAHVTNHGDTIGACPSGNNGGSNGGSSGSTDTTVNTGQDNTSEETVVPAVGK